MLVLSSLQDSLIVLKLFSSAESLEIKGGKLELSGRLMNLAFKEWFLINLIADSKTWTLIRLKVSCSTVA
jgi:hypothetical protein